MIEGTIGIRFIASIESTTLQPLDFCLIGNRAQGRSPTIRFVELNHVTIQERKKRRPG